MLRGDVAYLLAMGLIGVTVAAVRRLKQASGRVRVATRQAEQPVDQRRTVGDRYRR
jgi:hypothetical protein